MRALWEVCAGGSAPLSALHLFDVLRLFYNDFSVFHRYHVYVCCVSFFGLRRGVRPIYIWRFARPAPGSAPAFAFELLLQFSLVFLGWRSLI